MPSAKTKISDKSALKRVLIWNLAIFGLFVLIFIGGFIGDSTCRTNALNAWCMEAFAISMIYTVWVSPIVYATSLIYLILKRAKLKEFIIYVPLFALLPVFLYWLLVIQGILTG